MRALIAIVLFSLPAAAGEQAFVDGNNPGVREIIPNDDTAIMVYIRDMSPGVTDFIVCPDPDVLLRVRGSVWGNDVDAVARGLAGEGCFLANDGWGRLTAVHLQNAARVEFWWLAGVDLDSGREERLERSGREYWAYSYQLGTMGQNERIEPIISSAFD